MNILEIINAGTFESIAEGRYGCTFRVQIPKSIVGYALKVERISYSKEVELQLRVKQDYDNVFQLPILTSQYLLSSILPEKLQRVLYSNCPKKYDEWKEDKFKGTFLFTLMELGLPGYKTRPYIREHTRQFTFGILYALYRLHRIGIIHRDVRIPNMIMRVEDMGPVLVPLDEYDITFEYLPYGGEIPALIDYGLALSTDYIAPVQYISHVDLDDVYLLYGPGYTAKSIRARMNRVDNIDYSTNIDYWMFGIAIVSAYTATRSLFWNTYAYKPKNPLEKVPLRIREVYVASGLRDDEIAALWSMAQLSGEFAGVAELPHIYPLLVDVMQELGYVSPYQAQRQAMSPLLRSLVGALLTWNEKELIDGARLLTHPYFEPLRAQMEMDLECAVCGKIGANAQYYKCAQCKLVYCSKECHHE